MTVSELIEKLQVFDKDHPIKVWFESGIRGDVENVVAGECERLVGGRYLKQPCVIIDTGVGADSATTYYRQLRIPYCDICAMEHNLPLCPMPNGNDPVAGYCRLCGVASPYVGWITLEEAKGCGIEIKPIEGLVE